MRSTERGARLLAAADGDVEHAQRIDAVLDDLAHNSRPPAEVIHLPRPYDYADDPDALLTARDREPILRFDDAVEQASPLAGWPAAIGAGLLAWAIFAAIAYALIRLVEALT